ncbi:hypothetical protein FOA52_006368 [Chlamydomonas sp. UWO 241]|nr:hypothetical protein FOA52_006368 [Chlamydomonas sp. UWO 241]
MIDRQSSLSGPPSSSGSRAATEGADDLWYLVYFVHRLLDFRLPDVEAVASSVGVPVGRVAWRQPFGDEFMSPCWYIRLPSDAVVQQVAERSMLTRGFMEVWGEGSTWEELTTSIEACPAAIKAPWLANDKLAFKVHVESYGCKIPEAEKVAMIRKLAFIPFMGPVSLKAPDVVFWLIVCKPSENLGIADSVPDRLYFGRQVAQSDRSRIGQYTLSQRAYIGPTSMDTEMAFLMANMGKVRPGHLVLDPYAGTGSCMVAAAVFGAQVMGTDIDIRVISHGKPDKKSGAPLDVFSNFEQYGLTPRLAGLLRMDCHINALRPGLEEIFHAVIGDPPYGVRAGGRKSAPKEVTIRDRDTYIPSTQPYAMGECLRDLLDLSARLLVPGGRLVYFFPASLDDYDESEVPTHPALAFVANSLQLLNTRYCRRLVTMEKVRPYDAEAAAAHHAAVGDAVLSIDNLHDVVYEERDKRDERREGGGGGEGAGEGGSGAARHSKHRFRSKVA